MADRRFAKVSALGYTGRPATHESNRCMLKGFTRFLQRPGDRLKTLFNATDAPAAPLPSLRVIPRDEHPVSRRQLSENALKVLYRLQSGGYQAYLVGGCIRDALLGQRPKDFDVATNATPEQVRELFRNARIIGRRFRIVHVRFGREVIEVTTFRGKPADSTPSQHTQQSEDGMLLRDNVFGSIEEDALRRDFTINALYYDVSDFTIHDWANGVRDIEARMIRLIGDPETRYREDPVRMLRAVRFAGKLDFDIEEATAEPMYELAPLLLQIPPARMFEEVLKLFMSGYALETFHLLREFGLFQMLFPETEESFAHYHWSMPLIEKALASTDDRIREDKPVTPAFLYAALLWPGVKARTDQLIASGMPDIPAAHQAAQQAIARQLNHTSIPKRFSIPMREIWDMQAKLPRRRGKRAFQTREHPRFRAAYDFLLLREFAGEVKPGLGKWWTDFQEVDARTQVTMIEGVSDEGPAGSKPAGTKRRGKRRRNGRGQG